MPTRSKKTHQHRFFRSLYFQVIVGIVIGVALGALYPSLGEQMKPLGDAFIKLIKMLIAPIIFFTVVVGIASIGDMKKLGRVGAHMLDLSVAPLYPNIAEIFGAKTSFVLLLRPDNYIGLISSEVSVEKLKEYFDKI